MDGKTKAIVAHITIIGWIIAMVLNNDEKDEFASYYIRQTLGIHVLFLVVGWIPVLNFILLIAVFVFWIISLIGAIQDEKKEVPWLGEYFQDWFKVF